MTNQLITGEISRAIYTPDKITKNNYLTKTIHGELININKVELNVMNNTKSIISKQMRL